MRIPGTFAAPEREPELVRHWSSLTGLWAVADGSTTLALAPRLPRIAFDEPRGTLAGFISSGPLEGALFVERLPQEPPIVAAFYAADAALTPRPAELRLEGEGAARTLTLVIADDGVHTQHSIVFEWRGEANLHHLSSVIAIGHRGLGFSGLANRPIALAHAWHFGASGIEIDIIVPYKEGRSLLDLRRHPLLEAMTVYHPAGTGETEKLEDIDPRFHRLEAVLGNWREYGVPFLYLDAKCGWLKHDVRAKALERIRELALAVNKQSDGSRPLMTIAAVDAAAAEYLGNRDADDHLSWTLEWTEMELPRSQILGCRTPPAALSFDLNRISGSGKWPFLDVIMANLTEEEERAIGRMSQALFFWTANDEDHFAGALAAATHPGRMGRAQEPGEIAILTDYPHKLASWLAHLPPKTSTP